MARMSKQTQAFINYQIAAGYNEEKLGIGFEILSLERFKSVAARTPRIIDKIFSCKEVSQSLNHDDQMKYLASVAVAKEAVLKALQVCMSDGVSFADVEVLQAGGANQVQLYNRVKVRTDELGVVNFPISITYSQKEVSCCALAITQSSIDEMKKKSSSVDEMTRKFREARALLDDI